MSLIACYAFIEIPAVRQVNWWVGVYKKQQHQLCKSGSESGVNAGERFKGLNLKPEGPQCQEGAGFTSYGTWGSAVSCPSGVWGKTMTT